MPIHFLIGKPRECCQRSHSEIPTCMILYNFSTFIQPLKPVMFIFTMLTLYVLKFIFLIKGNLLEVVTQFRPVMKFDPSKIIRPSLLLQPYFIGRCMVTVLTALHCSVAVNTRYVNIQCGGINYVTWYHTVISTIRPSGHCCCLCIWVFMFCSCRITVWKQFKCWWFRIMFCLTIPTPTCTGQDMSFLFNKIVVKSKFVANSLLESGS